MFRCYAVVGMAIGPRPEGVPPILTKAQKRLLLLNYLSDSNRIKYGASRQLNLVSLCFFSGSGLPKGLGGQLTFKSGIFFKRMFLGKGSQGDPL